MLYFISIFIMLPILLVIFLIGLLTMTIPALKRFYPFVSHIFLSVFMGYVVGFVLSVLLTMGIAFLVDLLSNQIIVPRNITTLIGFFVLSLPLLTPMLGAAIGLIFSVKRKKQIVEMNEAETSIHH